MDFSRAIRDSSLRLWLGVDVTRADRLSFGRAVTTRNRQGKNLIDLVLFIWFPFLVSRVVHQSSDYH